MTGSVNYEDVSKKIEGLDLTDTQLVLSKLLEVVPESAHDLRALNDALSDHFNDELPEVGAYHEGVRINSNVSTDIVVPQGDGPFPVMVYLHGGAWVAGSPRHYAKLSCRFAEAGFLTFVIDYRLAPEHPFPSGYEDCVEATRWVSENCSRWQGDPEKIAIGGDSAGGNLSAAVPNCVDGAILKAAVLIYGAFDFKAMLERESSDEIDERVNRANQIASEAYLGDDMEKLLSDPRVSPINDISRLPPCHIVVGGLDALVVQSDALVAKLEDAGIEHEYFIDDYMPHGYLQMEMLPQSRPAFARIVDFLKRKLEVQPR